jgi:hypothetical protein
MDKKTSAPKPARRKRNEKPNITVVFNGKGYSEEEWKAYCETGEPSRMVSDYFSSDQCPPHQKAAWDDLWRSIIHKIMAEVEAEEQQKKNALAGEQEDMGLGKETSPSSKEEKVYARNK